MAGNILIVDDHPVVQMGMSSFMERNKLFSQIDVVGTGKEAVKKIKEHQSDPDFYQMAIVDINLPDYEALALVKFMLDRAPEMAIMMFSMEPPKLYIKRLIKLGVKGFLNKTSTDDEMLFAIRSIISGKSYFSSDILMEVMNDKDDADELSNISNDLSERESEILGLMIRGKSPKEICELLNLHKSSVATYRTRIFDKIGVKSNFELYQWALKEGLIHP
ncbi:response regulator [Croceimicrobium hydrocarbonivorans]|uniref:Response regulator transcription factor n=1 Tax=Croceimicrobium hydrocarbonivorans TaxID=2761580 RepID=A0A7H0VBJ2_9FLAO|nr:response regulator transcription factor [Croceimicrobium hydrocarbonivorans]QNR23090.1 response regulator transcription factor [Croceimicrobium hydrocarbonivorans]